MLSFFQVTSVLFDLNQTEAKKYPNAYQIEKSPKTKDHKTNIDEDLVSDNIREKKLMIIFIKEFLSEDERAPVNKNINDKDIYLSSNS